VGRNWRVLGGGNGGRRVGRLLFWENLEAVDDFKCNVAIYYYLFYNVTAGYRVPFPLLIVLFNSQN